MSQPIRRTLVETYLCNRGIKAVHDAGALRFHPRCYYRPDDSSPTETWPAMIAAVTDLAGRITGAHRTWLAPDGFGKAPVDTPRRAMGGLLGHAVRFGAADDVLAVGEGIETMLSLRCALPAMPMAAALSANHLAALLLPPTLRRLYIARDADAAGDTALAALTERAEAAGHRGACPVSAAWATSTRTCTPSASARCERHCASNSRRRMSFASWLWATAGRDEVSALRSAVPIGRCPPVGESRAHGLLEGDRTASGPARQWRMADYFPSALPRLYIAKQNSRPPPSSARASALRFAPGAGPVRPPSGDRHEGRDGRGRSDKGHHP